MRSIVVLFLLAGCAPRLVSSNSAGGIINMTGSLNGQARAMVQADAECKKYGKVALAQGTNILNNTMRYQCVTP